MTTITLTEAELKLIEAQRAKETAERLQAEAKKAKQVIDAVAYSKKNLDKTVHEYTVLHEYKAGLAKEIADCLNAEDRDQLVITTIQRTLTEVPHYYDYDLKDEDGCSTRVALEPIRATAPRTEIKLFGQTIDAEYYEKARWTGYFRAYIGDWNNPPYYRNAKSLVKAAKEKYETQIRKQKAASDKEIAKQAALEYIKEKYPQLTAKLDTDYDRYSDSTNILILTNPTTGTKHTYKIYPNKEKQFTLSFLKVSYKNTSLDAMIARDTI